MHEHIEYLHFTSMLIVVTYYVQPALVSKHPGRTKRFMSDDTFQPLKFWYLPACVASEVSLEPSPPGKSGRGVKGCSLWNLYKF